MTNKIKWNGFYLILIKNNNNGEIKKEIIKNEITNNAKDEIIKPLYGDTPDMEIKELAIGDGTSTPAATNTILDNEVYRISDTTVPARTGIGENTTEFVLRGTEFTGQINEIGIFAGSGALPWGAGAGKDTGLLISRVLWSHDMLASEEIYFQRIDEVN